MKLSCYLCLVCCFLLLEAKKKTGARQLSSKGVLYSQQDPSDSTYKQLLQLAISSVDENWRPAPGFYYSPIESLLQVESSIVHGEGAWYNMAYTTPNGFIYYGDQCDISFTVWPIQDVPTYKDVTVQKLQCIKRVS